MARAAGTTEDGAPFPDPAEAEAGPAAREPRWVPADVVVAAAVVGTAVLWMVVARGAFFLIDDWILATRARTAGDLLHSYNGHLSVPYLLVYRLHMALFGFDHFWILRLVGVVALAATPALLHVTTRARIGTFAAGLASVAVLWSRGVSLEAAAMNHWAVLALAVVTAWGLEQRSRRGDVVVAATLALGLLTAGGTVAIAVGCLVHCLLRRAPLTRWLAVVAPLAAWYAWYRWEIGSIDIPEAYRLSRGETVRLVADGTLASLEGLVLGWRAGAWLLLVGLVVASAWRLHVDRWAGVVVLATWWAANAAWWVGLASSRGVLADPQAFRYRFVGSVLLYLSLVPPGRRGRPEGERPVLPRPTWWGTPRGRWAQAGVLLAVTAALVAGNLGVTRDHGRQLGGFGRSIRVRTVVAFADPAVVPGSATYQLDMGALTQAQMEQLRDWYGPSYPSGTGLDRALVDAGAIDVTVEEGREVADCRPFTAGPAAMVVRLLVDDDPVTLRASRFGDEPVAVAELPARSEVVVLVGPNVAGSDPWVVEADGACLAGP